MLAIEATEQLGPLLTSLFTRHWRRLERYAGPFLLEKCSHDMDILNWLTESRPQSVSSFAQRTRFVPLPDAAERCGDCRHADTCRYSPMNLDRPDGVAGGPVSHEQRYRMFGPNDDDLCVFNCEKDIPDHQTVMIQYDSGVLASFVACMDTPRTSRTITIFGTEGQIRGTLDQDELKIEHHARGGRGPTRVVGLPLVHDDSGHHGGDSVITAGFEALLWAQKQAAPRAGLREGIEACLVALAAEQARHQRSVVSLEEVYQEVFDQAVCA